MRNIMSFWLPIHQLQAKISRTLKRKLSRGRCIQIIIYIDVGRERERWSGQHISTHTDIRSGLNNHYRKRLSCRVSGALPSVLFRTLGKDVFTECFFWHSAKSFFAECYFFYTRQKKIQSTFWSSKLIQIKKFSTTKLYNSSRCTMFVLVFSSYNKVKINLFTNLTYLSCSLWNYKRDI